MTLAEISAGTGLTLAEQLVALLVVLVGISLVLRFTIIYLADKYEFNKNAKRN